MTEYPKAPATADATAMMILRIVPQRFFFMIFLCILLTIKIRINLNHMRRLFDKAISYLVL